MLVATNTQHLMNQTFFKIYFIFLLAFLLTQNLIAQNKNLNNYINPIFNNYNFNKESIKFIKELEPFFFQIRIIEKESPIFEHGFSGVINDTAEIEINKLYFKKEELLIHELYHLYLRVKGFPTFGFSFSNPVDRKESNFKYLNWFTRLFGDKIEHAYFYPFMLKKLKVNPYLSFKEEVLETINKGEILGLNAETIEIALAGYYLQTYIETKDESLTLKFKDFLLNKYNGKGIELGEKLILLFEKTAPKNVEDLLNLFVSCFNVVHESENLKIGTPKIKAIPKKFYILKKAIFPVLK